MSGPLPLGRRAVLGAALGTAALSLAACGSPSTSRRPEMTSTGSGSGSGSGSDGGRVLLAYFSRAGENYWNGGRRDLEVGNTEVLAGMVLDRIGCDVFEIRPADPYSEDYDDTVARNVREQEADDRPAIAGALPSLAAYDTVVLASPIWNVRPPMIMETFTEGLDLSGTTVLPLVTYAVSGLGDAEDVYRRTCPGARFGEALAVRGEEVSGAGDRLDQWISTTGLGN